MVNSTPKFGTTLKLKDDSLVVLTQLITGDSSNLVSGVSVVTVNKHRFTNGYTKNQIWNRDTNYLPSNQFGEFGFFVLPLKDDFTGLKYHLTSLILPGDSINLTSFYTALNDYTKDSLLFTIRHRQELIFDNPIVYNSEVYIPTYHNNGMLNYLRRYDLMGNVLSSRLIDFSNFDVTKDFSLNIFTNLKINPMNDSFLTMGAPLNSEFVMLNRYNFETETKLDITNSIVAIIANNNGYRGARTIKYEVKPYGIEMHGMADTDFSGIQRWQYYNCKIAWDSSLISYNTYGDTTKDDVMYGFVESNGYRYIAGFSDFSNNNIYDPIYRTVPIVRLDSNGIVDSLRLFGLKNHRPFGLISDKNGNLILGSYFSNAWTNDSIFLQLTKIPIGILTSIREQKLSRNVAIYPNPTRDFIYSDEFENGDVVQIFNQQGQLLKEERINYSNGIDVRFLRTGTYFFQLIRENERQTVLFIKTD
jgi:hypothetical protein